MTKYRHIYVERDCAQDPLVQRILSRFPRSTVILIDHYKDVFNRRKQSVPLQHRYQNLILARRTGRAVFPGAPVCQSFGNAHFYYCSSVMNCLYDCEYCYLKGMYPSGNLVVFVNLEDIFREVEALLLQFPVYLCISYDTDLLPLEDLLGYVKRWCAFTAAHENLVIEIRTKCGRRDLFAELSAELASQGSPSPKERIIFAFTLSPERIAAAYERGCASFRDRISAASAAEEAGFPVRLCFDPLIFVPDWRQQYLSMLDTLAGELDLSGIRDFSIGSFRISEQYLKNMRRQEPRSAIAQYPYIRRNGYCQYPEVLAAAMEQTLQKRLLALCPGAAVFRWEEDTAGDVAGTTADQAGTTAGETPGKDGADIG